MSDFDLSSASAAASAHLASQSETPETPTPSTEGQVGNTQSQTPPTPGAEGVKEPAGQQVFRVKENGKEVEVTLEELLSGHLRHRDYTKKTMEVAEHRKQLENIQQATFQREQAMNDFLKDSQQVAAYYQYLTGQQLSGQQVQQLAQQTHDPQEALKQMRQEMMGEVQKMQEMTQGELARFQQTQQAARAADFERDINSTVKGLLENPDFESLHDIGEADEISDFLCSKAMQMGPRNIDEAKEAILNVAKAKLEHISTRRKEMLKKNEAGKASLKNGIEPPGGTAPTPKPHSFKLGDKDLTKAATAYLESLKGK